MPYNNEMNAPVRTTPPPIHSLKCCYQYGNSESLGEEKEHFKIQSLRV